MPWSPAQNRLFEAAAHDTAVAKAHGIPRSTAQKLASEGIKKASGGQVRIQAGNEQLRLPAPTIYGGGKQNIITGTPFRPRWGEQARPFADGGSANPMDWPTTGADLEPPSQDENTPDWLKAASGAMLTADDAKHIPVTAAGAATGAITGTVGGAGDLSRWALGSHSPLPTFDQTSQFLHNNVPGLNKVAAIDPDNWQGAFQAGQYMPVVPGGPLAKAAKGAAEFARPALRGVADLANTDIGALLSKFKPAVSAAVDVARAEPSALPATHVADATMADFQAAHRATPTGGLGSMLANNGSGESSASLEDLSRRASEAGQKHYMVHESGMHEPIPNMAGRADRLPGANQMRVIEHPSGAIEIHSTGAGITPSAIPGILSRFKQSRSMPDILGVQ